MFNVNQLLSLDKKKEYMSKMIALSGVTLSPEEADRFITYVWDQSILKNNARLERMNDSQKYIRGLGLTSRILKPASTFSSSDYVTEFAHNTITLTSKHFRAAVAIFDSDLEDMNVGTPEAFKSALMSMVTAKLANELEEIFWIADAQSLSGFGATDARSQLDGWRYQLDHSQSGETYENDVTGSCIIMDASNTVTAAAADYRLTTDDSIAEIDASAPYRPEFKYNAMLKYIPSEYKRIGLQNFRFFNNDQVTDNYIDVLEARGTQMGDNSIMGQGPMRYHLTPIISMPLMPTTMIIDGTDAQKEHLDDVTPGTLTDCLLTPKDNLIVGIQRQLKVEPERSAADEATYFFYSIRADCVVEDVHACCLLKRLKIV